MKEEIMEILTGVRSDVDFENSTKLIDDGISLNRSISWLS